MNKKSKIKSFVELIINNLPNASIQTDRLLFERGFEKDESDYLWIETFADVTNKFIRQRDTSEVSKHFLFFSKQLQASSAEINKCIEVSYVENLFFELSTEDKKWAWDLLPDNLKKLYLSMWGEPGF